MTIFVQDKRANIKNAFTKQTCCKLAIITKDTLTSDC